jgi:hypothetical protein
MHGFWGHSDAGVTTQLLHQSTTQPVFSRHARFDIDAAICCIEGGVSAKRDGKLVGDVSELEAID